MAAGEPSELSDRALRALARTLRRRRAARGVQGALQGSEGSVDADPRWPPVTVEQAWRLLELAPGASLEQAEESFRRLLRAFHPDAYLEEPERHADAVRLARLLTAALLTLRRVQGPSTRR